MSDPPTFNFRGGRHEHQERSMSKRMRQFASQEQALREDRIARAIWQINHDAVERFKAREL